MHDLKTVEVGLSKFKSTLFFLILLPGCIVFSIISMLLDHGMLGFLSFMFALFSFVGMFVMIAGEFIDLDQALTKARNGSTNLSSNEQAWLDRLSKWGKK